MSKTLLLFVTSENPDPYLNSVCHCILKEGVTHVLFLHIVGMHRHGIKYGLSTSEGVSARISRRVQSLLENLASGNYIYFTGESAGKTINLGALYSESRQAEIRSYYSRVLNAGATWEHRDIDYSSLPQWLAGFIGASPETIFDVTAIKKAYLGDLIAISITSNVQVLSALDLLQKPNHDEPWTMLLHDLEPSDGYQYVNLLGTPIYQKIAASVLVKRAAVLLLSSLSVLLLLTTAAVYFWFGERHALIQLLFIGGSLASIVSLVSVAFSRRWSSTK